MSIINQGVLADIKKINSTEQTTIFENKDSTGLSSAYDVSGRFTTLIISVRGTWVGNIRFITRFLVGDSNVNIEQYYDEKGFVHDRIRSNGTYYINISGAHRIYGQVVSLTSGSVSVYCKSTNNISPIVGHLINSGGYTEVPVLTDQATNTIQTVALFKEYKSAFFNITGTWAATIVLSGRRHGSDDLIPFNPRLRNGRVVKAITSNGTYFFDPAGWRQIVFSVTGIASGSVSLNAFFSELQEPKGGSSYPVSPVFISKEFPPYQSEAVSVVDLEDEYNSVTVYNDSKDTPIQFLVNGKWNTIDLAKMNEVVVVQPGGAVTVYFDWIDSLLVGSYFNYAQVRIVAGQDLPNVNYPGSSKYEVGYHAVQALLKGKKEYFGYRLMHIRGNRFALNEFPTSEKTLKISDDAGKTFVNSYTFTEVINKAFILNNNDILVHIGNVNEGDVYLSKDDGLTYTKVLEGVIMWYNNYAIEHRRIGGEEVVMFAEYGNDDQPKKNIWRSNNGGETWASALEVDTPTDIRHFHTLHWVQEIDRWIATTGDTNDQTKWYRSTTGAGTAFEVVPITAAAATAGTSAYFRLLGMAFDGKGIVWATDAASSRANHYDGIFRMDYTKMDATSFDPKVDLTELVRHDTMSYLIAQFDDDIIVGTRTKLSAHGRHVPTLYYSPDRGKTWQKILQIHDKKGAGVAVSGFYSFIGRDGTGRIFLSVLGESVGVGDSWQNWEGIWIKL